MSKLGERKRNWEPMDALSVMAALSQPGNLRVIYKVRKEVNGRAFWATSKTCRPCLFDRFRIGYRTLPGAIRDNEQLIDRTLTLLRLGNTLIARVEPCADTYECTCCSIRKRGLRKQARCAPGLP